MEKELIFITVIGKDRKGIVARIATFLYKRNVNIEDIMQKIVKDHFVMAMLVDIKDSKYSFEKLSEGLVKLGKEMSLTIQVQHENIFKMMHRI